MLSCRYSEACLRTRPGWFDSRPFASIDDLFATLCATVKNAGHEKQLSLLCAHPELGVGKKLTPASEKEQTAVGLTATGMEAGASRRHIATLNQQYREKFGFPFIIAVKGHSIESIMDNLERRLSKPKNTEFNACLEEVYHIAQFRLQAVFGAAD